MKAASFKAASFIVLVLACWLSACAYATPIKDFASVRAAWRPSYAYLLDHNGAILQAERVDFQAQRLPWVALADISPAFIATLVALEDRRFYAHAGVDWRALAAALWQNLRAHGRRGASTITMQLASLLDEVTPHARRGLRAKWRQVRAAQSMESSWTKAQILEAYVNEVGFRGELRGIGAAAATLFGKQPAGLTADEALLLTILISTPNVPVATIAKRACVLAQAHALAHDCNRLTALAQRSLDHAPAPFSLPAHAPHLARRLLRQPGQQVLSTLDLQVQDLVHDTLNNQLARLGDRNVRDAAAVVLDNASGGVLAYVGGAGLHSRAAAVDGVMAARQAGSTLKPFLYGLAFEQRYLTPASLLEDSPINLETATGLYIPQNYERDFKGVVSARTALASSLNVPAVRSLVLVGVERFRARLFDLGYVGIVKDGEYYGYSLALGSAEVSLLEQANAYRSLANEGRASPVRFIASTSPSESKQVMDPAAAFLVSDVLSDPAARALTFGLDNPLATSFWAAVKTGTSKDMRDNWCVGFSTRYTVAVWVGNFEGDAMADVSGITGAAPAWASIMQALHGGDTPSAPSPPASVVARDITFVPALEPPRREWFIDDTAMSRIELISAGGEAARIVSPANGVVIAIDPDIPPGHQSVLIESRGALPAAQLYLDDVVLGPASKRLAWFPQPGYHRLELREDARVRDSVKFTVRAVR